MPKTFDISLPIVSGGAVYPGNAPIEIETLKSVATGRLAQEPLPPPAEAEATL